MIDTSAQAEHNTTPRAMLGANMKQPQARQESARGRPDKQGGVGSCALLVTTCRGVVGFRPWQTQQMAVKQDHNNTFIGAATPDMDVGASGHKQHMDSIHRPHWHLRVVPLQHREPVGKAAGPRGRPRTNACQHGLAGRSSRRAAAPGPGIITITTGG